MHTLLLSFLSKRNCLKIKSPEFSHFSGRLDLLRKKGLTSTKSKSHTFSGTIDGRVNCDPGKIREHCLAVAITSR